MKKQEQNVSRNEAIVQKGYDEIGASYQKERKKFRHAKELNDFMKLLPKRGRVLDAGCGTGIPVAKTLPG